jgi:hypothetical protein
MCAARAVSSGAFAVYMDRLPMIIQETPPVRKRDRAADSVNLNPLKKPDFLKSSGKTGQSDVIR